MFPNQPYIFPPDPTPFYYRIYPAISLPISFPNSEIYFQYVNNILAISTSPSFDITLYNIIDIKLTAPPSLS